VSAAYNAATGARLWTARYNGPGNGVDNAMAVAVSPDGATVFVTGNSGGGAGFEQDYATVAYRGSDGTQLWVARFNGQVNGEDIATALSVARDGTKVFVTGVSSDSEVVTTSMATVAYDAADGSQLWVARIHGPAGNTAATAIASPGGNRVFVTGEVQSKAITAEYGTVAYNATTGARLWARRFAGRGATAIAVSPDRTKVYVTGTSHGDFTTLAYRARTGVRLWVKRYPGPGPTIDFANAMAVSPGGTVLVTGSSSDDYATVAYSPGGSQLWARRYNGPGINPPPADIDDIAFAVAAPGNGRVYVTGVSWGGKATKVDYATVAYNARTGTRVWVRRYNGPASRGDAATALAAGGGRVFVTGGSAGTHSGDDYATIAYRS
jgi:PQQ-like domain